MINQTFQHNVNQELRKFFEQKRKLVQKHDQRLVELVDQVTDLTLRGGKRVRPYMVYLGYKGCGGKSVKQIMPILLALELNHTYCLIHDDIMDQAQIRRNQPTIHAHFTQILRNPNLSICLAILAGDLCSIWAQDQFDQLPPDKRRHQARQIFNQMREETAIGQTIDVWGMKQVDAEKVLAMYRLKTAGYTIEKPLLIGAILAEANRQQTQVLSIYGQKLSLAYQLRDDLLDIFGTNITGKILGKDIMEGKWTVLIAKTWAKLTLSDRKLLMKILNNKKVTVEQINWVKQKIIDTGAKSAMEKLIQEITDQAIEAVVKNRLFTKKELIQLAEFVRSRDK